MFAKILGLLDARVNPPTSAGNAAAAGMASSLTTNAQEAGGAFLFALDGIDEGLGRGP